MISLDLSDSISFKHHRHGWKYVCNGLKKIHSKGGIYCDTFVESTFLWSSKIYYEYGYKNIPYKKDWIGFIHNPPKSPDWFDYCYSVNALLDNKPFTKSLNKCKCLITLSDYLKNWLENFIDIPIISIKHPTSLYVNKWNANKFIRQKYIPLLQIGYWLRNLNFIRDINCNSRYTKIWLCSNYDIAISMLELQNKTELNAESLKYKWNGISIIDGVANEKYDDLMTRSIVCLDLYDSSANNAIIECISRNTPIIVNKIPAVVEYLGNDYPLYFSDIRDVPKMVENHKLILAANTYLKNMNKDFLSMTKFTIDLSRKLQDVLC